MSRAFSNQLGKGAYGWAIMQMIAGLPVRRRAWSAFALQAYIKQPAAEHYTWAIVIDSDNGETLRWRAREADLTADDWVLVDNEMLLNLIADEAIS